MMSKHLKRSDRTSALLHPYSANAVAFLTFDPSEEYNDGNQF